MTNSKGKRKLHRIFFATDIHASELYGVRVFVNLILEKSLKAEQIIIDALDFTDDSLSLEKNYDKRVIMLTKASSAQLFLS